MKLLVVLSAIAACTVAAPNYGFAYSAYAPYPYNPYPYYTPYATPYAYTPAVQSPAVVNSVAPVVVNDVTPVVVKHQYHMQNELGQARYGFSEPHHAQEVVRDAAGNQAGFFSYVNPEGKIVQTSFVADALGYRVASNDLPVAPQPLPVAPVELPTPVEDTPEVAEAKARFFEEFKKEEEKTKTRSRRDAPIQTPASTVPLTTPVVAPVVAHSAMIPAHPYTYSAHIAPIAPVTPFAYSAAYTYGYPGYGHPYNYVYGK